MYYLNVVLKRRISLGARIEGYSVAHTYQIRENLTVISVLERSLKGKSKRWFSSSSNSSYPQSSLPVHLLLLSRFTFICRRVRCIYTNNSEFITYRCWLLQTHCGSNIRLVSGRVSFCYNVLSTRYFIQILHITFRLSLAFRAKTSAKQQQVNSINLFPFGWRWMNRWLHSIILRGSKEIT